MIFRHLNLTGFFRKNGRISKWALKRSSSTSLRKINPPRPEKKIISTLDPKKFAEKKQQCLHIGDQHYFRPFVMRLNQPGFLNPHMDLRLAYDSVGTSLDRRFVPFPQDTKAFLYYFTPPDKPRIAGELRLRVTSSDDPASFQSGSDLLISNGRPWSRPLYVVSKSYTLLYENMREDQLIPDDLHAVLSTLPHTISPRYRRRQHLFTLNDTFIVDFSVIARHVFAITEKGLEMITLLRLFSKQGSRRSDITEQGVAMLKQPEESTAERSTLSLPYTGSALVRFERSTLQEHKRTRTIVLRFLKIIDPVKCVIPLYDGDIVQPKEGELFQRYSKNKLKVWSVNIDGKGKGAMTPGFRLLWDT